MRYVSIQPSQNRHTRRTLAAQGKKPMERAEYNQPYRRPAPGQPPTPRIEIEAKKKPAPPTIGMEPAPEAQEVMDKIGQPTVIDFASLSDEELKSIKPSSLSDEDKKRRKNEMDKRRRAAAKE